MAKYINLERARFEAERYFKNRDEIKEDLDNLFCMLASEDVAPVRHGHWIHTDYALHWTAKDECSECTYHACDRDSLSEYNYCPNCGAKMDDE